MPIAELESYKSQRLTICYDIHGAGATPSCSRSLGEDASRNEGQESSNGQNVAACQINHPDSQSCTARSTSWPEETETPFRPSQERSAFPKSERHSDFREPYPPKSPHPPEDTAEVENVVFIAGLGARGRTEFFQHVVDHLASLREPSGRNVLSICTFDNRGIGGSTVFKKKRDYSTKIMAHDTLALVNHLQWKKVHVVGMSMGGMIATKFAAFWPDRVASLTVMSATRSGWHMLAGLSRCPVLATLAGAGPLDSRIKANLRFNFSDEYLSQKGKDGKAFKTVMVENTHLAIEEEDTSHFLAEGQPSIGRQGHLKATGMHRMTSAELQLIKSSDFPRQVIVGRYDRLARTSKVLQLSKDLKAPLLILDAAHAGIVLEAMPSVIASLEALIFGSGRTTKAGLYALTSATQENVLTKATYAKEFASTFSPGRVSFKQSKSLKAGS